jgi:hypothetical protein
MLPTVITLPGGTDGLWTLVFVPVSIVLAAIGGAIGILLTRRGDASGGSEEERS